jgi:hypothetical protein
VVLGLSVGSSANLPYMLEYEVSWHAMPDDTPS